MSPATGSMGWTSGLAERRGPGCRKAKGSAGERLVVMVAGDRLADTSSLSWVLRLVVDRRHGLRRGEVLDAEGKSVGHFGDWDSLVSVIRRLVGEACERTD